MTCSYQLTNNNLPPCLVFTHKSYKNLPIFLGNQTVAASKDELISSEISCISYNQSLNAIHINQDQCISCGSCALSCPGGKINFLNGLIAIPSCSSFSEHSSLELSQIQENLIEFTGNPLDSQDGKFRSFEKYTGINETTHISVWSANVAKYIFGNDAKLGLEIPLTIKGRDRNGRLDICVLFKKTLIVMESKVSLKKLMSEGRYEAQMLAYDEELVGLNLEEKYKIFSIKLLLIGDDETDLLPQNHEQCSSKVGNLSQIFYRSILKYGFQFISARGFLSLAMSKFINPNSSADQIFISAFKDPNTVGLLSNTLIKRRGDEIYLESLNL